jgi:hypothetical protein
MSTSTPAATKIHGYCVFRCFSTQMWPSIKNSVASY